MLSIVKWGQTPFYRVYKETMAQEIETPAIESEKELTDFFDRFLDLRKQIQSVLLKHGDLLLFLKDSHIASIEVTLKQFVLNCHTKRLMIQFDDNTIKFLHLLDPVTLGISFSKCLELEKLKNRTPDNDFISLEFSSMPYKADDIEQDDIDKMINVAVYEKLLQKNGPVFLHSIKERDSLLCCYVEDAEVSKCMFKPSMYDQFKAYITETERDEEMEIEKTIETRLLRGDNSGQTKEIARNSFNKMTKHICHESDMMVDLDNDLARFIMRRMGTLSHSENGLTGSNALFEGFFEHSTAMTNRAFERIKKERRDQGTELKGPIRISRGTLKLEDFDTTQKKSQTPRIRQIMADSENVLQIERHRELNISVNTMDVMLGKEALSRTVIPCIVQNAYNRNVSYVLNVYGNINITNTNTNPIASPVSLSQTEKSEPNEAILEEAPNTMKRKRVSEEEPGNIRRILISELKFNKMKKKADESLYLVIKSDRVYNVNPTDEKKCEACNETFKMPSFIKSFTKDDRSSYLYLKNVCHTCINEYEKVERKKKKNKKKKTSHDSK